ncbi:hypothetical protein L596_019780 [Steinernema carpocapsae]|uniref:Uncharacterized protein n=1 Tax=Steinernema carpocapsae TaxID=34508 RepID=A0A4U5MRJ3_STECR|nr:hypothetical protein L596_019780 [Steinernema carpocapsae]
MVGLTPLRSDELGFREAVKDSVCEEVGQLLLSVLFSSLVKFFKFQEALLKMANHITYFTISENSFCAFSGTNPHSHVAGKLVD